MITRRTLTTLALAALLGAPLTASAAQHAAASSGATPGLTLGGMLGFAFDDGNTGFALRGDLGMDFQRLAPNVVLGGVGSLGWTHFSQSYSDVFGNTGSTAVNILKIVPAARFNFLLSPQFTLYGDAGLGLYYAWQSATINGLQVASDSGGGVTMRFAVGGQLAIAPTVKLGAEFGANPFFGQLETTSWDLLFGATFKL
ncbi:MAG TPA: outer membrane beta-barrel protein [Anaeromyxobacter sp.]|nr:outer membrane beta-barrel protein [Anaeromyxobacter sp.]